VSTHKRWYCWTGAVQGKTQGAIEIEDNSDCKGNHVCKPGGNYDLFGARLLLDSPGEWSYDEDSGRLCLWSEETGLPPRGVEIKVRRHVFDLRGRQHITIEAVEMFGATLATDDESALLTSHNTWHFEGLLDKRFPKPGTAPIDSGRVQRS
jgi:hypothetical protein